MEVVEWIPCKIRGNGNYDYNKKILDYSGNLNSMCHRNVDCLRMLVHLLGNGIKGQILSRESLEKEKSEMQKRGQDFVTTTELWAINESVLKALKDHFEFLENARGGRIRELMSLEENLVATKESLRRANEKIVILEDEIKHLKDIIRDMRSPPFFNRDK